MNFFLLFTLGFLNLARATEPSGDVLKESLVLLEANGSCGTGFVLSSGKIITNSHVIDDKCNQTHCPDIEVSQANTIGSAPIPRIHAEFEIVATFPYSDMAILKPSKPLGIKGISGKIASPLDKETFFTIGFPSCESLQISTGSITQVTDHNFKLGIPIQKGQSGSPIFNKNSDIIGLVYKVDGNDTGLGTRIDHLGTDLEAVAAKSGLIDLKKLYRSYSDFANSTDSYIDSVGRKIDILEVETQVALSGQCPQLKDYWIWIHADFPRHVPHQPLIQVPSLKSVMKYFKKVLNINLLKS
jgi:hypothetical protein